MATDGNPHFGASRYCRRGKHRSVAAACILKHIFLTETGTFEETIRQLEDLKFEKRNICVLFSLPICSMVLVYLPTKLGDFVWANVGKYSSTMEHMGFGQV